MVGYFCVKKYEFWKKININNKMQGCAAFVSRNMEGDILFSRNMDCECAIPMCIRLIDNNSYKSLAFLSMTELDWDENTYNKLEMDAKLTLAAPYSPLDGINEYGLAVACLTDAKAIYPQHNKITLFDETLPRLILNKSKTVDEVIQLVDNYNLFFIIAPRHFLIADANGEIIPIMRGLERIDMKILKENWKKDTELFRKKMHWIYLREM